MANKPIDPATAVPAARELAEARNDWAVIMPGGTVRRGISEQDAAELRDSYLRAGITDFAVLRYVEDYRA